MKTLGIITAIILAIVLISIFGFFGTTCNNAQTQVQDHVINNAFDSYEEFQSIYNTCTALNNDLGSIRSVDPKDPMFDQFSKEQRIVGIKSKLNRWIEEYNAKSNMKNRALWKSKTLPPQLSTDDFKNYEDPK